MDQNMNPKAFPDQPWPDKESGMTLRDYFAAKAMQGILAGRQLDRISTLAKKSYQIADELLKVRQK